LTRNTSSAARAARRACPASLPGLFEGRGQLLIYHFMFDPDWDEGCQSCSFLAVVNSTYQWLDLTARGR
jgi:predicted dithiol-disulfide oxidoreductase (DUF899 family)